MNVFDSAQTTKSSGLLIGMLLLFCLMTATAQQPSDRIDPRQTGWKQLPVIGTMTGIQHPNGGVDGLGQAIHPIGDCNGDGLADWLILHTILSGLPDGPVGAKELLLYKGVEGGIPRREDGVRIGPEEVHSHSTFIASGDWDGDRHVDLAVRIEILDDTTSGGSGYQIARLVVFWGNAEGQYSLTDTTRLENGAVMWLGPVRGTSGDLDGDGVEDLIVQATTGFTEGAIVRGPRLALYRGGEGTRWGRNGIGRRATWWWWEPPKDMDRLEMLDQDCDGAEDLVIFTDEGSLALGGGHVTILYGHSDGGFPDTAAAIHLDMMDVNGHTALLTDISGDGIAELVVGCWATTEPTENDEIVKIYAGEPGQRLLEQFGSGDDPPAPEQGRVYSRPWAEIWMPRKLHDGWPMSGSLLYLGDANLDGLNDIWVVYRSHFILEYNSGPFLDSLIDAMIIQPAGSISAVALLGDIDGSGLPAIAVGYFGSPGAVMFLHPNKLIPNGGVYRAPFHDPGIRCGTSTGVDEVGDADTPETGLQVIPNPATGEVRVLWHDHFPGETVQITVTDALGRQVQQATVNAAQGAWVWNADGIVGGVYYVTLHHDRRSLSARIILRN